MFIKIITFFKSRARPVLKSMPGNTYKVAVRYVRQRSKGPKVSDGANAGLRRLAEVIDPDLGHNIEDGDLGSLETDFMQVHKSHKMHNIETAVRKEQEKLFIVGQKYFKKTYPNFLTWYDKEHIRYLHRTDPEEWTIEKLSKGFPALPDTIKKIIKSNWSKKNRNKIFNHDGSVQKNWQLFKEGKMKEVLPDDLKVHLRKFSNRDLIFTPFEEPKTNEKIIVKSEKNKCTEYSNIITSYQSNSTIENPVSFKDKEENPKANISGSNYYYDNYKEKLGKSKDDSTKNKKPQTLASLKTEISNHISKGVEVSDHELLIHDQLESKESCNKVVPLTQEELKITTQKKLQSKIEKVKSREEISFLIYPERITIPKSKHKQGYIYRLNDCFYDDDGLFLYRVPGLTS